jgi:hypothetical protein
MSSSATKFDRSAGIFATTATQNGLAANATNAAAKDADCQTLIAPCTPDFSWFKVRPAWRSFLWRDVPLLIFCQRMWHICHNSQGTPFAKISPLLAWHRRYHLVAEAFAAAFRYGAQPPPKSWPSACEKR